MKKLTSVFAFLLLCFATMAQDANEFSCQIMLNNGDNVLSNKKAIVRVSVLQDAKDGQVVYVEQHSVKTDADGSVEFTIGQGETTDDFKKLDFNGKTYYAIFETTVSGTTLSEPPVLLCTPINNQTANTSNAHESQQYVSNEGIDSLVRELQKKGVRVRELAGVSIHQGHEYVDFGLPSGTLWATTNVGAFNPEDNGYYFAWGETAPKEDYNGLKYRTFGFDDDHVHGNLTTLDLPNDAASVCWGGQWRMPTSEQHKELIKECYWVWTNDYNNTNVSGYIVYKAKNENDKGVRVDKNELSSYTLEDLHIFLPASGYAAGWDLWYVGLFGYYWSSSIHESPNRSSAYILQLNSKNRGIAIRVRYMGGSIRAVCPAAKE